MTVGDTLIMILQDVQYYKILYKQQQVEVTVEVRSLPDLEQEGFPPTGDLLK